MTNILDKDTFYYSVLHYFVLFLHIFRGLFLAKYLGAAAFGLYGIVILAQQQMSASALGMREATLIELSGLNEMNPSFNKIFVAALFFTLCVGAILFFIGIAAFLNKDYFRYYHPIGEYLYLICFHGVLAISNEVMLNVLRVKGKILLLGFIEVFYGLSIVLWAFLIIFFEKSLSVFFQLALITNLVVFFIYIFLLKGNLNQIIDSKKVLKLLRLGIPLLILNISTILMISSGQWIVGFKDTLSQLGIFSFAVSLAMVVNFGVGSLTWVYLSPLIAEYKLADSSRISELAEILREYLFTAFLLMSLGGLCFYFTIVNFYFQDYFSSFFVFLMIFFSQFAQLFCYPDNTLLLAKKKITQVSLVCIFTTIFITFLGLNIYDHFEKINLFNLSQIELLGALILIGNFIYMLSIFFLANEYKLSFYQKDLKFFIYFLGNILMLIFLYSIDLALFGIIFILIMLFANHLNTFVSLVSIVRKIFIKPPKSETDS